MPPKRDVEAPVCLSGFFDENEEDDDDENTFSQTYEVTELDILGKVLRIRQFAWHKANANKIWPGTFNLADYLDLHQARYKTGPILELGAATGALTMFLSSAPHSFDISTSDIDDDGEVQENIAHNFHLNGNTSPPLHIPHTWGDGWPLYSNPTVSNSDNDIQSKSTPLPTFKFVIASDILLYVSAYPALVKTLCELFGCPYTPSATLLPPTPPVVAEASSSSSSSSSSGSSSDSTNDGGAESNIARETTHVGSNPSSSPQLSSSTTTSTTTVDIATTIPVITKAISTIAIDTAPSSSSSSSSTITEATTPTAPSSTSSHGQGHVEEFLMSWNRRIAESKAFFDLMEQAGFVHEHKGRCIYSFTRRSNVNT